MAARRFTLCAAVEGSVRASNAFSRPEYASAPPAACWAARGRLRAFLCLPALAVARVRVRAGRGWVLRRRRRSGSRSRSVPLLSCRAVRRCRARLLRG